MIIRWQETTDKVHDFEWSGSPRTQEGRWIKERTGWSTIKFLSALEELDPDAIIALIIILSARDGRKLKWDEVDLDPLNDIEFLPSENEKQQLDAAAEKAAAAEGKGALPSTIELPNGYSGPGLKANGLLAKAASNPRSEPTLDGSGVVSG